MVLDCIPTNILLYCSHSLSRWGDRMWSFAVGLFLINLHPQSFLVSAAYEITTKLFVALLTGPMGVKLDSLPRLSAMRFSLILQNSAVAGACVFVLLAFRFNITYYCDELLFYLFIILVTLMGIVSSLSSSATKIVIERDWIVVLTKGDREYLGRINSSMRRIDQICLLLAPILAGAFVSAFNVTVAAGIIAGWNVVSLFFEYNLLRLVYSRIPELAVKKSDNSKESDQQIKKLDVMKRLKDFTGKSFLSFKIYFQQKVALIGFCLSLIYLTVLGFGVITVGYLRLTGVEDVYIGVAMGVGAVFGVLGTFVYTPFVKRFGTSKAGVLGAVCLFASICLCLSSVFFKKELVTPVIDGEASCNETFSSQIPDIDGPLQTPTLIILIGITTLRFGLWIYDLAISQHFQEVVAEKERNTVGGVQASINSFFDCLYILLTICIPNPNDFDILIEISFAAVAGSCVLYVIWFLKTGGIRINQNQETEVENDVNAGEQVIENKTATNTDITLEERTPDLDSKDELLPSYVSVNKGAADDTGDELSVPKDASVTAIDPMKFADVDLRSDETVDISQDVGDNIPGSDAKE